jgi:tetratricopeptide (TPR) repeat protein
VPRPRVIGLVVAVVIVLAVVGGAATGAYGLLVSKSEHDERLRAACEDADALRGARLLDQAADAYGAIDRVAPSWRCRGSDVAIGPGPACDEDRDALTVCDESQREAKPRVMTASAWQEEVQTARRLSGERLEQASQYQRVYRGASGDARDEAGKRALSGYLVGLYIDPGATAARREAHEMLTGFGDTTGRPAADERCERAGRLFDAGLVPESRTVYMQALHSGRTTVCRRNGLLKERWTSAWALAELKRAAGLQRAGHDDAARRAYIHAFAADSSLAEAATALAKLPGPDPADAKTWSTALHAGSDGWDGIQSTTEFVQGKPETLATAVALLGAAFLLACLALQWIARIRVVRPWMDRLPPLRQFTRTQMQIEPFGTEGADDGENMPHIAELATSLFQYAVRRPPLTEHAEADAGSSTLDVIPAARVDKGVAVTGDVTAPLNSLQGVAAALTWVRNLIPREEIKITGQLLAPGDRGRGLRLHVHTRRGRPIKWRDFWHHDLGLSATNDARQEYLELARYAAAWVAPRALRPRTKGDWRPNAWFQFGLAYQQASRYPEAIGLYARILGDARFARNAIVLHNLAVCQIRAGDHDGALDTLDTLDRELGQSWHPKPRVKRPYSAGYNRALALQYKAMAGPNHAAAHYREALAVSRAVLLARFKSRRASNKAPAALMLHAGLLLSTADPLEPGRDRDGAPVPHEVIQAARAIAWNTRPRQCPGWADLAAHGTAEDIAFCVRQKFGGDKRALYNLACFEARLAARYPPLKDKLSARAKADLRTALSDPRLKAWAPHDPALHVRTFEDDEEWQALLGEEAREPAAVG